MDYRPIYVVLLAADGITTEASASAYVNDTELPKGYWRIKHNGYENIMRCDSMPEHWRRQLAKWTNFAEKI